MKVRHFLLSLIFILVFSFNLANAQKLVNIDNNDIRNIEFVKTHMLNPADDVYDMVWSSTNVHIYKNLIAPCNYKINLKTFAMPLKKHPIIITSNYGYRKKFRRNHNGIDLKCYIGDTIHATFSGKVRAVNYDARGYGYYVVIRHYNGLETIYGHMSKQLVKVNEYVEAGHPIGLGGNTGRSFGSHLHLETRFCGIPIDPTNIFDFEHQDVTDDYFVFK